MRENTREKEIMSYGFNLLGAYCIANPYRITWCSETGKAQSFWDLSLRNFTSTTLNSEKHS